LGAAVERPAFDQLEVEVGRSLEDRVRSGLACDHREERHLDAVDQTGGHQRPVQLEEFGNVIARGGSGVVIASQSGHRLPALTIDQNKALATTPAEEYVGLIAFYLFLPARGDRDLPDRSNGQGDN
jgi:hypothetical protein